MHGAKTAGFVIESRESLEDLARRLRPALNALDMVENYWITPAPITIEAKDNSIDPFRFRLLESWNRIRKRRYSEYMREGEGR